MIKASRAILVALAIFLSFTATVRAQISLDLRDADLRSFVEIVAQSTGRNFTLDNRVDGTVTVIAPGTVNSAALYEIFLNVLELNRLTIIEGEQVDRIVPLDIARELPPSERVRTAGGAFETRVFVVRNISLGETVEVIRPLLPAEAVLSTVEQSGLIILSDRRENIDRIGTLIGQLDQPRRKTIETIRLNYSNAQDILSTIQALEIVPPGGSVTADFRSNAIVVSGNDEFRSRVRTVVNQLDTPQRSTSTSVVQLNYADALQLEGVIARSVLAGDANSTSEVTIVAEPQTNSIIVTAPSDRVDGIVNAIKRLDQRPSQVLVEAVIFELSVQTLSDLSVQFGGLLNDALFGGAEFSVGGRSTLTSMLNTAISGSVPSPGSGLTAGSASVNAAGDSGFIGFLSALSQANTTRLLATPSILTLNNTEAEIVVAQSVPFVTGSFATVGDSPTPERPFQTIERQDVGLKLRVTPQITGDNTVRMEISQEASSLTRRASAAGGEITSKRTLSTNVLVGNGQVIMLGGLLENGAGSENAGVPGLSRLPLLGALFRGRAVTKNQRVLLLLLRPRVVTNDREATRLSREVARDAKRATRAIQPDPDGQFPNQPLVAFPFDGANLNQPFDAGFIDDYARSRTFPPLPSRLQFNAQ
ncbi:General secretion pathway protein D [Candidatus Rhodobacter oscarellae]|uniref:General secretion pathway protein D n=1 Tax=Candidatus Rhodobacter oscarellae TaxID=1675527 RepID=A0A0J9E9H3_9RHOB|nr:secretin N-terminal domain-containing protein [Candidatus Rhodobacter lobularis]KMW59435.1 General secretion pathway protein D [Candidatus Rhodobacter lobularis]